MPSASPTLVISVELVKRVTAGGKIAACELMFAETKHMNGHLFEMGRESRSGDAGWAFLSVAPERSRLSMGGAAHHCERHTSGFFFLSGSRPSPHRFPSAERGALSGRR